MSLSLVQFLYLLFLFAIIVSVKQRSVRPLLLKLILFTHLCYKRAKGLFGVKCTSENCC